VILPIAPGIVLVLLTPADWLAGAIVGGCAALITGVPWIAWAVRRP
jgi:hypothetical protein